MPLRRVALAFVAALLLVSNLRSPASAGVVVDLNVPTKSLSNLDAVVTSRFRLSRAGSFDQVLYKQPDVGSGVNADIVAFQANTYIGSATYDFTVKHTAATAVQGGKFEFGLTNGVVAGDVIFRGAGANSTLTKTFLASGGKSELDYNILHVFAQATTTGAKIAFSGLYFTPGAGLATSGSLATTGSIQASSTYDQWLAAPTGTNLDNYDWTFGGRVTLTASGTNPSSGEGIKFEFTGKHGTYASSAVPEPSTAFAAALGVGALALLRKKSR